MEQNLSWEVVKEFYQERFGIDGWVVEMYAVLDVLILCASGASNDSISKFTEIPVSDIRKILEDTFQFSGWELDMPINPYRIFQEYANLPIEDVYLRFYRYVYCNLDSYPIYKSLDIEFLYKVCKTVYDIERKIQDEWI